MNEAGNTPNAHQARPRRDGGRDQALIGFTAMVTRGRIEFRLFGEHRPQPGALLHFFDDGDVQAALMGRLYYRADTLTRSGGPPLTQPENDAELAARAYRHGGTAALEQLEGEFGLVLSDRKRREIVALRDPMGGYPIYWTQSHDRLVLGTSLRAVAAFVPDAALDLDYFGEVMSLPFLEIDYFPQTPFQGIHRLVSGAILTSRNAAAPEVRTYWDWRDRVVDPGTQSTAEAGAQYGELLRQATHERLRGTVAAHLSGGMDSTSTALLAAREAARRGDKVHALSLVYAAISDLAIEQPYVESALAEPGLVAHRIPADEILDYDLFANTPVHEEPYTGLFRAGTDVVMNATAAANGCATVLTGLGADEVLDPAPYYMADLLRGWKPLQAWREAARWARAYNTNPWRYFRMFAMAPLTPAGLHAGLGPISAAAMRTGPSRPNSPSRRGCVGSSPPQRAFMPGSRTGSPIRTVPPTPSRCRTRSAACATRAATGCATICVPPPGSTCPTRSATHVC